MATTPTGSTLPKPAIARLHFITYGSLPSEHLQQIECVLDAGIRWVQLRMKEQAHKVIMQTARQAMDLCRQAGAVLIINDHVDVGLRLPASGVHVGKEDMPLIELKQKLQADQIVGATANTLEDIIQHYRHGADYIGLGPYRFTTTKQKLSPLLGIEGYRRIVGQINQIGIRLPIIAIGGIQAADVPLLLQAGVWGVAVSGAIVRASKPVEQARRLLSIIEETLEKSNFYS